MTAADALLRLLADVSHARDCMEDNCKHEFCSNRIDIFKRVERLALDGLAGEAEEPIIVKDIDGYACMRDKSGRWFRWGMVVDGYGWVPWTGPTEEDQP